MKKLCFLTIVVVLLSCWTTAASIAGGPAGKRPTHIGLKVYHFKTNRQEALIDSFLQRQYLPVLHAAGIPAIGVFKPIGNDTAADRRVYVLTPFTSLKQWESIDNEILAKLPAAGGAYENVAYNNPAYARQENMLLKAFDQMKGLTAPKLAAPKNERVYELRSYEGASEKVFRNKVQMFNAGGEITLFDRLQFNGIFYGEVLFGSQMPNLLYMTSFANMPDRDAHWRAFSSDPEWKRLSGRPEYQHNVSHMTIVFLRPTAYSDL